MESQICPGVEISSIEQDCKLRLVDDLQAYINGTGTEYLLYDHLLWSRHLLRVDFENGPHTACTCCNGAMTFTSADALVNGIM